MYLLLFMSLMIAVWNIYVAVWNIYVVVWLIVAYAIILCHSVHSLFYSKKLYTLDAYWTYWCMFTFLSPLYQTISTDVVIVVYICYILDLRFNSDCLNGMPCWCLMQQFWFVMQFFCMHTFNINENPCCLKYAFENVNYHYSWT